MRGGHQCVVFDLSPDNVRSPGLGFVHALPFTPTALLRKKCCRRCATGSGATKSRPRAASGAACLAACNIRYHPAAPATGASTRRWRFGLVQPNHFPISFSRMYISRPS
jgi:hypothetical protein